MKDEFISVVSHELRTPLTSIHGALGMLASGLLNAEPETGKRLLEIIAVALSGLMRLINDILDIERIESSKVTMVKQTCDANLMLQAADAMRVMADKAGVTLSVSPYQPGCGSTQTGLFSNAIKFSSEGFNWLTAELGNSTLKGSGKTPLPHASRPTPPLKVPGQDQGVSPADKIETIFERFQQVDASDCATMKALV